MTYEEFCAAAIPHSQRAIAIDRALTELPRKIREAISAHLEPPSDVARLPTLVYGREIPHVSLYRKAFGPDWTRQWEPADSERPLETGGDGLYQFSIGICVEGQPKSSFDFLVYSTFIVEEFDEHAIELSIENSAERVKIDLRNANGYALAASEIVKLIADLFAAPASGRGSKAPLGFHFGEGKS